MDSYTYILLIILGLLFLAYLWMGRKKKKVVPQKGMVELSALQMQAYERLALLLERSKPTDLLFRLTPQVNGVEQLQLVLLSTILQEFEHNYAQQIYVSEALWQRIVATKEKLFALIDKVVIKNKTKTVQVFSEALLAEYARENSFVEGTLQLLREEVRMRQNK